ncbi:MAG: hypothetical protein A2Y97_06055 [Nitrospirae bacterium RBG_13_39_12]|nr:MAG: hypothetical protein A2Y97_06055 [Nitrospirae bacterium RBG_13_39_12]
MLSQVNFRNLLLIVFLGLFLIFNLTCDQKDRFTGIYLIKGEELSENPDTYIELKENGLGVWRVLDDEVSFRWDIRDNKLRLHIKSGGVVIGKIHDDTLEIAMPGPKIMYFKKKK